ncbi:MAG TPA: NADH:flavin oxidoreductase/NADH oxidase [Candidatus Limnocylindria bacterium]|jgi:2,4-dienoyl-CoA reductase-like NADH-dependent reductase (Old Yellow Enzyme family)|nr:NADH:flavin oxidoreductase/NADH oxidase [Candidatus Limnocylindria bacterium]
MSTLFSPFRLRDVTLRNRIVVSPMCEYSSDDGFANDWHVVHLGSRAVGGAGLVLTEAIAVTADGRITPWDLGIYRDEHVEQLARIARFCAEQGAAWGTQLAHAGRKASTKRPWEGTGAAEHGGWTPVAPTGAAFDPTYPTPQALDEAGIAAVIRAFADGARRTREAGGTVIELHFAHGYLVHEFLTPLVNTRTDRWGGSFENRIRLAREIARAVRAVWPEQLPLFARVSSTDWVAGGWDAEQTVALARALKEDGVDLIDCSSGGAVPVGPGVIPVGPLYQTPFAEQVRREAEIPTGSVGMIAEPADAETIVADGRADLVFIARELLRDPYWPLFAARALGAEIAWPPQYQRATGPRATMQIPVAR